MPFSKVNASVDNLNVKKNTILYTEEQERKGHPHYVKTYPSYDMSNRFSMGEIQYTIQCMKQRHCSWIP